jgi:hypothetical protein
LLSPWRGLYVVFTRLEESDAANLIPRIKLFGASNVMGLEVVSLYGSTLKSVMVFKTQVFFTLPEEGVYSSMVLNRLSVTNL